MPTVLKTDTGNFNRFLTSLGLLLLAAALLVPYFYFQNTDTLEIPAADLRAMTATGRDALEARQDAIAALEAWVVVGAVSMAVVGLLLVIWGAIRLREVQVSDDKVAELQMKRAALEVEEMSPTEKAQQVTEKAKVEVQQEVARAGAEEERGAVDVKTSGRARTLSPVPPRADSTLSEAWRGRVEAITRISDRIRASFAGREPDGYDLKWQVRIGSATEAIRLDGVFEAREGWLTDIVLEIRVSSAPRSLRSNAGNIANDLIARLSRYRVLTARPATAWLIIVVPAESKPKLNPDGHGRALDSLADSLGSFGKVSLLNERELGSLPALFVEQFGSA